MRPAGQSIPSASRASPSDRRYVFDLACMASARTAHSTPTKCESKSACKTSHPGTGRSVTLLELVAALNRLLGTDLAPWHAPPRAGDVRHSRADISRARRELGYEPAVAFEDGLARTLAWFRGQA